MKGLILALGASLMLAFGATGASAATVHVETDGVDSPTCGTSVAPGDACLTIKHAYDSIAADGDTIEIGSGTFPLTEYIRLFDKSVTFKGAGESATIIDGQDSTALGNNGMFRAMPTATPLTVGFQDLSMVNIARRGLDQDTYAIYVQPQGTSPARHVDLSISNVSITGSTGQPCTKVGAECQTHAVISNYNGGSVTIDNLAATNIYNGTAFKSYGQVGAVSITNSTLEAAPIDWTGVSADVVRPLIQESTEVINANGDWEVVGARNFSDNTISGPLGIQIHAGTADPKNPPPPAAKGFTGGMTISRNTIETLESSAPGAAIALGNYAWTGNGAASQITDVEISENKLTGTQEVGNTGVEIIGNIADAVVKLNNIREFATGVQLNRFRTASNRPSGTMITDNQIVNTDDTPRVAFHNGTSTVNTTLSGNWFGCNAVPVVRSSARPADCVSLVGTASQVTNSNWIVLNISADPTPPLAYLGTAEVRVDLTRLNNGGPAEPLFDDGTVMPLTATMGTLDDDAPLLVGGKTQTDFTSFWRTGRSASTAFDNQVSTHSWDPDPTPLDLHVELPANGGLDDETCGPLPHQPCATIKYALDHAITGDRILIGEGTFTIQNPDDPTKFVGYATGNRELEFIGSGPDKTVISGLGVDNATGAGIFRLNGSGDVVIRDLKLTDFPRTSASTGRFAVYIAPATAQGRAVNVTVDNVEFEADTTAAGPWQQGINVNQNRGTVNVLNSVFQPMNGNMVQFDSQVGEVNILNNTFTQGTYTGEVIRDWTHGTPGGSPVRWDQIGKHTISGNTITAPSGIQVLTGTSGTTASSMEQGLEISNNTITITGSLGTSAIHVNNGVGADGQITDVQISGNTITGNPQALGVRLTGDVPDAEVTYNDIRNVGNGVQLGTSMSLVPTNTVVHANKIVGTGYGVSLSSPTGAYNAQLDGNWWGCNTPEVGRPPATSPCNGINGDASQLTLDNWIVLRLDSIPFPGLTPLGTAALTLGLDQLNTGDPAPQIFADGTELPMTASNGDLAEATPTTANGATWNAFTSTSGTGRAATVSFDDETVERVWDDNVPPTVVIVSPDGTLITNQPAVTLSYAISGGNGDVTCNYGNGASVALNYGVNTILVICTDEAGNNASAAVSVIYDNVPPTVTILSPVDGLVTRADSVRLNYVVGDDFGVASCTPDDESLIPLKVGSNTVTVTCVDRAGNTTTVSAKVSKPDPLPTCAKDVAITSVQRTGTRTRIRGIARLAFVGQKVAIQYRPTGKKTVGTVKVKADGSWSIVVKRPARPKWTSNQARYRAVLKKTTTGWLKLSRRMNATAVTYNDNGGLRVTGSASKPVVAGRTVRVMRSDACGAWRTIGTVRMNRSGTFSGTVPSGGGSEAAVYIRVQARVAQPHNTKRRFNTYSIVQPVIVER